MKDEEGSCGEVCLSVLKIKKIKTCPRQFLSSRPRHTKIHSELHSQKLCQQ